MTPEIYIKLSSGWLRIKERVARVVRTRRKGRGRVVTTTYSLVGESVGKPPEGEPIAEIYISAFKITKLIHKIMDSVEARGVIVFEPYTTEVYKAKIYGNGVLATTIESIARDLKALKKKR